MIFTSRTTCCYRRRRLVTAGGGIVRRRKGLSTDEVRATAGRPAVGGGLPEGVTADFIFAVADGSAVMSVLPHYALAWLISRDWTPASYRLCQRLIRRFHGLAVILGNRIADRRRHGGIAPVR